MSADCVELEKDDAGPRAPPICSPSRTTTDFDAIARLAALALGAPNSVVTVIDEHHVWFEARYGFDATEVPKDGSICTIAMRAAGPTVFLDTHQAEPLVGHPAVSGEGAVRFYAGAPLMGHDGRTFGMLCVFDTVPRASISPEQLRALVDLAAMTVDRMETAGANRTLRRDKDRAETFLRTVVDNLPAMVFVKDAETRQYLLVNEQCVDLIGMPQDDVVGHTDAELFPDGWRYALRDDALLAEAGGVTVFESQYLSPAGSAVTLRTKRILVDGPERSGQYILGLSENVTETRLAQAEVTRLATHDSLTTLLNRRAFLIELELRIAAGRPFALIDVDLDRFKWINDRHGHPAGDETLLQIAARLLELADDDDRVARTGGDEFSMIVDADRSVEVTDRIHRSLAAPFEITRGMVEVGASCGVAKFPADAGDVDDLRRAADLAMYRAKAEGGGVRFYSADMDAAANDRRAIALDLSEAIVNGDIRPMYQPVIAADTGAMTSVEALARWRHPKRGDVPPDVFIPIAEELGLIEELGTAILRQACADAARWPESVRVAVNVSPRQIHGGHLCRVVADALRDSGITPDRLQLEVTEGLFMRDVDTTFRQLAALREFGIQILMDDFGTGYSSLSYFQRFTFDKVKIDQSFVRDVLTSRAAAAIIRAIVELGDALGMRVVAEGVETQGQMKALVSLGCTHLQGYLFSPPVDAACIRGWAKSVGPAGECAEASWRMNRDVA